MKQAPCCIYTSGNNAILARLTRAAGWLVGMRSDKTACTHIDFMDIKYREPNFDRHLAMVKEHRPKIAVVPDLSDQYVDKSDIYRALRMADLLTPYCETVLIVPKLSGQIPLIPPEFGIGYSLPSSNGGAKYGIWKLDGRRVHLLGGSPHMQRLLADHCSVASIDGNMMQRMAFSFCKYWQDKRWIEHPLKHTGEIDLPYKCLQMSLENIMQMWRNVS